MFCAIWLLFYALLAVSATSPNTRTIQREKRWNTVPHTPFISMQDGQFFVNGSVFKFVGTNAYWLSALNNDQDVNKTLADIKAAGFTVVRTWAFNDVDTIPENGTWFQLISNGTLMINEGANGLQKLDKVIDLAQDHGLFILPSLTNNWNPPPNTSSGADLPIPDGFNPIQIRQLSGSNTTFPRNFLSNSYGGMDAYVRNFGGPQEHAQFYTNETLITAFMNYTSIIVNRYKNRTNVFGWELANDPRCNSTIPSPGCVTTDVTEWHSRIATQVQNLDPNHVVSSGNQGFFCGDCPKRFATSTSTPTPTPTPTPVQASPPQVSRLSGARRSSPESQSKAKLLKERKAAWKRERERQKRAGVQADAVKIRGRWTAFKTKRQSDLSTGSAFDGTHGVDSADIIAIPQIGFSSFQWFPDQFNYTETPPDPTLPAFNQTLEAGLNWVRLHVEMAQLFNKPVILAGFGLVTQNNSQSFVPFNSTVAPFAPDSTPSINITQPFGVTDDQRDDAYRQIVQAALSGGLPGALQYQWSQPNLTGQEGTEILPPSNETDQSITPNETDQSPNDGYGILGQGEPDVISSIQEAAQGFISDSE